MKKLIYYIGLSRSKVFMSEKYSSELYERFCELSKKYFDDVLPRVPNIGQSIFSFNFCFAPAYIAWYKAFVDMGIPQNEIDENIWGMNERLISIVPKPLMHGAGKMYLGSFRKKAVGHVRRQRAAGLHPYDWYIDYRDVDENCFELDIKTCGIQKLAREFGAEGLLPGICRVDYLLANMLGNGFERTKTLGDGDDCCDCCYFLTGNCEWSPQNGFDGRK